MHTLAALVSQVTGIEAGLTVVAFMAGSVWAPLGIWSWGRRVRGEPEATAAAVVIAVATPWFLMSQLYWGFWPLVVAVALVPACAVVVITAGPRWRLLIPVLAVIGLFAVHIAEVLVVALLVGLTLAGEGWRAASKRDPHLLAGLNVYEGRITNREVAQALGLPFVEPAAAIA
jgi:hypothetical protein